MVLDRNFYERDSAEVAKDLLGTVLSSRTSDGVTSGRIVETEAYFGVEDPASRATEKKNKINELMWDQGGLSLVYMVHANWLFNAITEEEGRPGGVLIRALEPVEGLEIMKKRRGKEDKRELTSGPGKLTEAMAITKEHHGLDLTDSGDIEIFGRGEEFNECDIRTSHRIGVTEDLERELRFYIPDSICVSKP